jgi:hypothetical protein
LKEANEMRIAFFGDGTLDLYRKRRDGSIVWRREMFQQLVDLGHDPVYIAKQSQSESAEPFHRDRVVGWDWRGEVDAIALQSRRPFFAPSAGR